MKKYILYITLSAIALITALCSCQKSRFPIPKGSDSVPTETSVVKILKNEQTGKWVLAVNDKAYYVNGAATNRFYTDVHRFGGNTIRLYSPSGADCRQNMDDAYQAGLMVYLGLGMTAAESMDYSDPEKVAAQKEKIRSYVKQYQNHPALLCWSVGNEIEAGNDENENLWKAVGDIAAMIKELDPNHPVTCALASSAAARVKHLAECGPIDFISVNSYYPNVGNIAANLQSAGVDLPYMVTEFGPRGTWAMGPEPTRILPWGDNYSATSKALVEETSYEKSLIYENVWNEDIKANESKGCLGSFAFVWGYQTHGEVLNWYASHTTDKYSYNVCDILQKCWTGALPEIQAPKIESRKDMTMNGKVAEDAIYVEPGSTNSAKVVATTESEVNLRYHWFIFKEGDHKSDGSMPDGIEGLIKADGAAEVSFKAPSAAGGYRLYVFALDDVSKKAASACIPFCVENTK